MYNQLEKKDLGTRLFEMGNRSMRPFQESLTYNGLVQELLYLENKEQGLGHRLAMHEVEQRGIIPEEDSPLYELFTKDPIQYLAAMDADYEPEKQEQSEDIPIQVVYEILQELRNDARKRGYHVQ